MKGGSCRGVSRGSGEPLDVECHDDRVEILREGRVVRTVTGVAADEIREAIEAGDDAAIDRLVSRAAGKR